MRTLHLTNRRNKTGESGANPCINPSCWKCSLDMKWWMINLHLSMETHLLYLWWGGGGTVTCRTFFIHVPPLHDVIYTGVVSLHDATRRRHVMPHDFVCTYMHGSVMLPVPYVRTRCYAACKNVTSLGGVCGRNVNLHNFYRHNFMPVTGALVFIGCKFMDRKWNPHCVKRVVVPSIFKIIARIVSSERDKHGRSRFIFFLSKNIQDRLWILMIQFYTQNSKSCGIWLILYLNTRI